MRTFRGYLQRADVDVRAVVRRRLPRERSRPLDRRLRWPAAFSSTSATLSPAWAIAQPGSMLQRLVERRAASIQTVGMQVGQALVVERLRVF